MSTELTTIPETPVDPAPSGALSDLRQFAMALPSDVIQAGLAEFTERRDTFRKWLLGQLKEGIHFGYPPGTAPKFNEQGEQLVWQKGKGPNDKGRYVVLPKGQWQFKPSLYKAGADFVCELMGLRDEYAADMDGWKQLGGKDGHFVYACYLVSRSTGDRVGEGRGVRMVGQKGGDANNAIKMAKKCAKVDAVINAYGLADLFTQDIEDDKPQPHQNPEQRPDAPRTAPRGKRQDEIPVATLNYIKRAWVGWKGTGNKQKDAEQFSSWVREVTMRDFDPLVASLWTLGDVQSCCAILNIEPPEAK